MTITTRPEQERLIAAAIKAGIIGDPQQALDIAVDTLRDRLRELEAQARPHGRKSLARLFAESPLKGLDLKIEREQDTGRPLDL